MIFNKNQNEKKNRADWKNASKQKREIKRNSTVNEPI